MTGILRYILATMLLNYGSTENSWPWEAFGKCTANSAIEMQLSTLCQRKLSNTRVERRGKRYRFHFRTKFSAPHVTAH